MYKDKDKQREANRKAQARFKAKGITNKPPSGITEQGITNQLLANQVIPNTRRGKDIKCFADLPPDVQQTIDRMSTTDGKLDKNEKAKRTAAAIKYQHLFPDSYESAGDLDFTRLMAQAGPGHVRVSKPGDDDYVPQCETTRKYIDGSLCITEETTLGDLKDLGRGAAL